MPAEEEPRVNPALAASEFHGRVGSAGPDSSPAEAEGLAQSCVRAQARFPQRPDWPDPQSQSFSRSYGSILPTSLTYVILSARGFSPWRPAADMGTTMHEIYTPLIQIFKGQRKRFGWHKTCATFSGRYPYLRANRFQGSQSRDS